MRTVVVRGALAIALVFLGWAVGRAQNGASDFVLRIDGPLGRTAVTCVRGCNLQGGNDRLETQVPASNRYEYACGGRLDQCTATVNGWLRP
jgi:hypothetical protein